MKPTGSYIFLITRPAGTPTDRESLTSSLAALGVQVDLEYGVVPIDPLKLRFALRGSASAEVIEKLDSTIEVFTDPHVGGA
jgi:hypothetical protein